MISLSGDAQFNPGPKIKVDINLCLTHWYLNKIVARNFLSYENVFVAFQFGLVSIPKTYLDSNIPSDDGNLEILGYKSTQYHHPSNSTIVQYSKSKGSLYSSFTRIYYL